MLSLTWLFAGALLGLLIVSVFTPPDRKVLGLPIPNAENMFFTSAGCVKFKTTEVPCTESAKSLNFIASQHK